MNATTTTPTVTDEQLWLELDAVAAEEPTPELRAESEVRAHMLWAGSEMKRARAAVGPRVLGGWLHSPDLDLGIIGFTPHTSAPVPDEGDVVRVAYGAGDDAYVFEARLVDEDEGTWLLDIPNAIGSRGQRLTGRALAYGQWFFAFEEQGEIVIEELHDLSTGGIGLLTGPDQEVRPVGQTLTGLLHRVDGFEVEVVAVVRHVSRLTEHPAWRVTGCTLMFIDNQDQVRLAGILAE